MRITFLVLTIFGMLSCQSKLSEKQAYFELLGKEKTGISFENNLVPTLDLNVFNFMYFYNGGGVAVADFNQDELPDIYFTGNMVPNALYLNEGNLKFKDITDQANVSGQEGWTTGVTVVDINQDGMLDLYVSQIGKYRKLEGFNQLYVCQSIKNGIPIYQEMANEYGLDIVGFSTQAGFFDYDLDGDLDMFQLRHSLHQNGTFGQRHTFTESHELAGDLLFKNENGKFTDVTESSGIISTVIGYGLGVAFSDINLDGWPDIYIGNDFHENDYLYLNQQDGTFKESLNEQIQHTSRFSMGVDIADVNNDGFNEIISLDMLPYDPVILKSSLGEDSYGIFQFKLGYGYNYQYARNNLQLNNQDNTFSEVAMFAGVHATDWSWAPLFLDFDNDGNKDLFITNGIPRRMNDIDYVNFYSNDDIQAKVSFDHLEEKDLSLTEKLPRIKLPNRIFRNQGGLQFTEIGEEVKNNRISFSNGSAYADFDLDGDLDIVTNNIEDEAFIYKNLARENDPENSHFIKLILTGPPSNQQAIGARTIGFQNGKIQTNENYNTKGFQSSIDFPQFLGTAQSSLDSLYVIWPDQTFSVVRDCPMNSSLQVNWQSDLPQVDLTNIIQKKLDQYIVDTVTSAKTLNFIHRENPFVEFHREQLIPHMVSAEGPAVAVGDINGDQLDDVFLGGSKRKKGLLFFQTENGTFHPAIPSAILQDSIYEDVSAELIDVDGDSDLDLLIASGGNEYLLDKEPMQQRIYINDGQGNFSRKQNAFNDVRLNASCIRSTDIDGDGDLDIFIGARSIPWAYGKTPSSYLFLNDGKGNFNDVTLTVAPALLKIGMVTDARWVDIDQDNDADLIVALEWGPVTILENENGAFTSIPMVGTDGWWKMIHPVDMDGDGDLDFIAGNTGENSRFRATIEEPLRMYVNDFDTNGQIEQLVSYYVDGEELLFSTYAEMTSQLPEIKKNFLYAKDFANTSFKEYFDSEIIEAAEVFHVFELRNCWFENTGEMNFKLHPLPKENQLSPLMAAFSTDLNGDNKEEILLAGNFYENNIEMGRYDADYGTILTTSQGSQENWKRQSLKMRGQVREIVEININEKDYYLFVKNNARAELLEIR